MTFCQNSVKVYVYFALLNIHHLLEDDMKFKHILSFTVCMSFMFCLTAQETHVMWHSIDGILQQNLPRNCATQTRISHTILKGSGITAYETVFGIPDAEELYASFLNDWLLGYTSQTKDSYSWYRCDKDRRAAVSLREPYNSILFIITASRDPFNQQLECTIDAVFTFVGTDKYEVTRNDQCFEGLVLNNNFERIKRKVSTNLVEVGGSVPSDGSGGSFSRYDMLNIVQMDIMTIEEYYYNGDIIPDVVNPAPGKKRK